MELRIEQDHVKCSVRFVLELSDREIYNCRELNLDKILTVDQETAIRYMCHVADNYRRINLKTP